MSRPFSLQARPGLIYVFAYGSLCNRKDLASSLKGQPFVGPVPAVLEGHQRAWNMPTDTRVAKCDYRFRPGTARAGENFDGYLAYLGLAETPGATCTGMIIGVTPAGFERLVARETNYSPKRVEEHLASDRIRTDMPIVSFMPDPEWVAKLEKGDREVCVRQGYLDSVETALYDAGLYEAYKADTQPPPSGAAFDLARIRPDGSEIPDFGRRVLERSSAALAL